MTDTPQSSATAPSPLRLIFTLAVAGLISGIAIIAIYESTLPTITANRARELQAAVFRVLPGAENMQALVYRDQELLANPEPAQDDAVVYGGYDDSGKFIGYAIPGAGPGFQDTIGLLYGFDPARRVVLGMEILESRETPGLGDKIYKDADFVAGFQELSTEPQIVAVKKGSKSQANELDAITGATISSKAVVRIINETHAAWRDRLPTQAPGPDIESPGGARP